MKQVSEELYHSQTRRNLAVAFLFTLLLALSGHYDGTAVAAGDEEAATPSPVDTLQIADTLLLTDSLTLAQARLDSLAAQLESARLDSLTRADSLARALEEQSLYQSGILHSAAGGWWVYGDSGFVAGSTDGQVWRQTSTGTTELLLCADWHQGHLFLGGKRGRIYDLHFDTLAAVHILDSSLALNDIKLRPDGNGLCVGDEGLIGKTDDGGRSWTRLQTPYLNRWYQVEPLGDEWLLSGGGGLLVTLSADTIRRQIHPGTHDPLRVLSVLGEEILLGRRGRVDRLVPSTEPESIILPGTNRQVYDLEIWGDTLLAAVYGGMAILLPSSELFLPLHQRYLVTGLAASDGKIVAVGTHGRAWGIDLQDSLRVTSLETGARKQASAGFDVAIATGVLLPDSSARVTESATEVVEDYIFDPTGFRYSKTCDTPVVPSLTGTQLARKVSQLNDYGPINVAGRVLLRLYISSEGELVEQEVLGEYPYGLNYGRTAERVLRALSFEPAQCDGQPLAAWTYLSMPIDTSATDYGFIMNGELEIHYQLREAYPNFLYPEVVASPAEKLKQLQFPSRAKRFVWRGEAIVEYDLDSSGQASSFLICDESEGNFEFGLAAIDYLAAMEMRPAQLDGSNIAVHVIHHVVQDRRRKKPASPGFLRRLFGGGKPDSVATPDTDYIDKVIFSWPQQTEARMLIPGEQIRSYYATAGCGGIVDTLQLDAKLVIDLGGLTPPSLQNIFEQEGSVMPGDIFTVLQELLVIPALTGRSLQSARRDTFHLHIDSMLPDSCFLIPFNPEK